MTNKPKTLVLTDTPAKARSLKRLLGRHYTIAATDGFLRDLPRTQLGIEPDNDFALKVITVRGKAPLLNQLRRDTVDALRIYVATEPGCDGEALAAHYCQLFGINPESNCRVELKALTKDALKSAIENARAIENGLVEKYWTRRCVNRLISYSLNPYIWCAVYRGLSLNQMQLMLLRLIDRYKPLTPPKLDDAPVNPKTLQLWAALENFSAGRAVLIARQLYEGIALDKNFSGLITYFRGDPIEPASEELTPDSIKEFLSTNQLKICNAIWSRRLKFPTIDQKYLERPTDFSLMLELDRLKLNWADTYSAAINTLVKNHYVDRIDGGYSLTDLGNQMLSTVDKFFSKALNEKFIAELETQLKAVAEGRTTRLEVLRQIYEPFHEAALAAMHSLGDDPKPKDPPIVESDQICDKCGRRMIIKNGRYGKFLACPGYPECKNTMPYVEQLEEHCPKCGGHLTAKTINRRRVFYSCEHYPDCSFGTWDVPQEKHCSTCGAVMLLHQFKDRQSMMYCSNEDCPSRSEHPINKILEKARRQSEERRQRRNEQ